MVAAPLEEELSQTEQRLQMVWHAVRAIPEGSVATYGDVARAAGLPGLARFVGYALRQLSEDSTLPWHRVVNSQGKLSLPLGSEGYREQKERLLAEGIRFNNERISLKQFRWRDIPTRR